MNIPDRSDDDYRSVIYFFTPCPLCFLNKKLLSGNLEAVFFLFEVISYTQVLQTTDRIGYC